MSAPDPARLQACLERQYGIAVDGLRPLDQGVFHVARRDGPDWVARYFAPARTPEVVAGDAALLTSLAEQEYPAERLAAPEPAARCEDGTVLVTEYLPSVAFAERRDVIKAEGGFRRLGEMLGELHALPVPHATRSGGAWHHLADGGPAAEIAAARQMLAQAAARGSCGAAAGFADIRAALGACDSGAGLPEALLHPDFNLANTVVTPDQGMVLVDWTGAGRGPRLWSLAWLLFCAGAVKADLKRMHLVLAGYAAQIRLEPEELDRLEAVMLARPLILEAWKLCHGRASFAEVRRNMDSAQNLCAAIAKRVCELAATRG